jgi:hypothetical protein
MEVIMTKQKITDVTVTPPASASGCGCGSHAATSSSSTPIVATCCGTKEAANTSGACCDPVAKKDAVAAGASCCG